MILGNKIERAFKHSKKPAFAGFVGLIS